MIFFIASVAETNRAPFDLAEAESELVSGFMTEHAAGIFVFFFLAEYASIILMCILISVVLLGGYEIFSQIYFIESFLSLFIDFFNNIVYFMYNIDLKNDYLLFDINEYILNNLILSTIYTSSLAFKSYALVFLFI
jgi:NADH-ubiquinone oxidoreductase chain 1